MNCLLSMNNSARRWVFCTVSKTWQIGLPRCGVKTYIKLICNISSFWICSIIVSRGDWLWNPANFKGWSLCLGFSLVTWSRPCTTVMLRWSPEYRRNRSSNQKFWFWLLNLLLIYRVSSCQEIIVSCLAVAQVERPKEWEYGSYRTQKTRTTKNGGKIGSGKLRRQEKLIATRCLHARKTFIVKISKHVSSKIKKNPG